MPRVASGAPPRTEADMMALRKMRILHTSHWHISHTLHDLPRGHEHLRFLDCLGGVLADEEVDAFTRYLHHDSPALKNADTRQ